MDLSPRGIRKHLDLNRPIYARTSAYGHFGRAPDADGGFSWEKTDLADSSIGAVSRSAGTDFSRRSAGPLAAFRRKRHGAFYGRRKGKKLRARQA